MTFFGRTNPRATRKSLGLHTIGMGCLFALVNCFFSWPYFVGPLTCFAVGAVIGWLVEWQGVDSADYDDDELSESN